MSGKRLNELHCDAHRDFEIDCLECSDVLEAARGQPPQHWVISVQDSLNDYREVQGGYFDGTERDAERHFRIHKPWARYFGQPRYQITMRCNSVVLQWPES